MGNMCEPRVDRVLSRTTSCHSKHSRATAPTNHISRGSELVTYMRRQDPRSRRRCRRRGCWARPRSRRRSSCTGGPRPQKPQYKYIVSRRYNKYDMVSSQDGGGNKSRTTQRRSRHQSASRHRATEENKRHTIQRSCWWHGLATYHRAGKHGIDYRCYFICS